MRTRSELITYLQLYHTDLDEWRIKPIHPQGKRLMLNVLDDVLENMNAEKDWTQFSVECVAECIDRDTADEIAFYLGWPTYSIEYLEKTEIWKRENYR